MSKFNKYSPATSRHQSFNTSFNPYANMGSINLCQALQNIIIAGNSDLIVNDLDLIQNRASEIMWIQEKGYKHGFNARGLSTIITLFMKISLKMQNPFKPSIKFLADWEYTATKYILEFNPQELANSIYAFAKLNVQPSEEFLEVWLIETIKQIENFTSQNLANSIYALSQLKSCSNDLNNVDNKQGVSEQSVNLVHEPLSESASKFYEANSLKHKDISLLRKFLECWKITSINKIDEFKAQELVNGIYGVCKLYLYLNDPNNWNEKQELSKCSVHLVREQTSTPKSCEINYSDYSSIEFLEAFLKSWEKAAINKIREFIPQGLANSIYAFSQLGRQPSEEFLKAWQIETITKIYSNDLKNGGNKKGLSDRIMQIVHEYENTSGDNSSKKKDIEHFKGSELASIIYAFAKLNIQPLKEFWEIWQIVAIDKINEFNAQGLANIIYAFGQLAQLNIRPSDDLLNVWEKVTINKIDKFSGQGLANIIYAFGQLPQLSVRPSDKLLMIWEKVTIDRINEVTKDKINEFSEQGLANIIYAFGQLAQLSIRPSDKLLMIWEKVTIDKIDKFSGQGLANIIYAFGQLAQLSVRPSDGLLNVWEKVTIDKIDKFSGQGLASIIYAFGQLNVRPSDELLNAWEKVAKNRINEFSGQGLANIIYAFGQLAQLGVRPSDDLLNVWEKVTIDKIDKFSGQGLANIIYAFGQLNVRPSDELLNAWEKVTIDRINEVTKDKIDKFSGQGLANIIYAFGKLEIQPLKKFLEAWLSEGVKQIQTFSSQNLANIIYAFGRLEVQPSEEFLNAWQVEAVKQTFNSQNLANIIYAFSKLEIQPSKEFLEVWQAATISKINEFNTQELTNSIYALMVLSMLTHNNYLSTEKALREAINKLDFSKVSIEGVMQIWVGANMLQRLFEDRLLEEKNYESIGKIIDSNKLEPRTSTLQKTIFNAITNKYKNTAIKIYSEYWIPELATSVDICIMLNKDDEKIIVQVDGPPHFIVNSQELNAATKLNTLLLNHLLGYEAVFRIPYYETDNTITELYQYIDNIITPEETMFGTLPPSTSELSLEVPNIPY